jgi:hypothetical protein
MSIFGSTFKPFVVRQLKARQALMAHGQNTPDNKRSQNVQLYTSAKTSWIKMSSFVNYTSVENGTPTDELARKYVLLGGTLWDNPAERNKPELRFGLSEQRGSYTAKDGLGYKPTPGIQSISINNEGAYGSLRSATIKYKCWTKQQLDDLEVLYMRTGYPVLLEWGWSMYLDTNNGKTVDPSKRSDKGDLNVTQADLNSFITKPIKSWSSSTINPFDTNKTLEVLYDDIQRISAAHSGNYDGMVGIIKNFSYEIEIDGSYTCTTSLISMGDALDSIKMNKPSKERERLNGLIEGYKTSFAARMSNIITGVETDAKGIKRKKPGTLLITNKALLEEEGLDVKSVSLNAFGNNPYGATTYPTYIQFALFIGLVNTYFNLYTRNGNNSIPLVEIELPIYGKRGNLGDGLCIASVDSVSIDPSVCIIRNSKATWVTGLEQGYYPTDPGNPISYKEFLIDQEASEHHNLGQIGNVYICVQYANKLFDDIMSSRKDGEVPVYTYIKELLQGVSYALGSINDFDVYVTDSRAVIMDKSYTELPSKTGKDTKFELNIFGLDTVVRNFKINSKIFQSQSSMIAIAASGKLNLGGVNSSTQDYFNKGLQSRLYEEITDDPTITTKETEEQDALKYAESTLKLAKYLNDFIIMQTFPVPGESTSFANTCLKSVLLNVNTDVNYRSVIPINTEIIMDGIAGIAIGEVFRINSSMLPKEYHRRDLGFIVTSLKQTVEGSNWLTTLGAYVILLDQGGLVQDARNKGLSRANKDKILGYQAKFKKLQQFELDLYRQEYIKLLKFVAEYFANNIIIGLDFKNRVAEAEGSLTQVEGDTQQIISTPIFKNLYMAESLKYKDNDYSTYISEWNLKGPEGRYRYLNYGILPETEELTKRRMGLLDSFIRAERYDTIKTFILTEIQELSTFKTLQTGAPGLAKDILDNINKGPVKDFSGISSEIFDIITTGIVVKPIIPKLYPDGLTIDYREVDSTKTITIQFLNKDNVEQ